MIPRVKMVEEGGAGRRVEGSGGACRGERRPTVTPDTPHPEHPEDCNAGRHMAITI